MSDYLHDGLAGGTTNSDNMPEAPSNDYDRVLWQNNNDDRDNQRRIRAENDRTSPASDNPMTAAKWAIIEKDAPHLTERRLRNDAIERRFKKACAIVYVLMFAAILAMYLSESGTRSSAMDLVGNLLVVAFIALLGTGVVGIFLKPLVRRWPTK
ncbi:hypothetical protein INH39_11080 [Massilia violaceinigra]|uniref:DUF2975 domain-containing protein n=1 Tax=Massilia violaceinigra TaxID=2045208 RepID=A0ABY4ABU7_9BURK|nr:hypothetical protein [Massilia violaceinigra]UOD32158.1 hypothetical protein INH39_11080 [Massilia violaceinigra]